jgi:hypothetical protein
MGEKAAHSLLLVAIAEKIDRGEVKDMFIVNETRFGRPPRVKRRRHFDYVNLKPG